MAFRSKSPRRVLSELTALTQSYGLKSVECVDNILDMKYVPVLFELLRDSQFNLELFYEVKANLRHEQLATLRGGVRAIQPGIESFSNQVLRLMRKGCTRLQNIQLLRWCVELDIQVGWNILAGFPGIIRVRPTRAYYYTFHLGRKDLTRMAYFFDSDYADGRNPFEYIAGLTREVQCWIDARTVASDKTPRLDAICAEDELLITDTRSVATAAAEHLGHLWGDVPALLVVAAVLALLTPRTATTVR